MAIKHLLFTFFLLVGSCAVFSQGHLGYQYTHVAGDTQATGQMYPVYVDVGFGTADLLGIEDALTQWNHVLNGYARFRIVDSHFDMQPSLLQRAVKNDAFFIFKIDSSNALVAAKEQGYDERALAFVNTTGGHKVYVIRDRLNNDDITYILLHEIGHALGAIHSTHGLMYPVFNHVDYQCVDYTTTQQIAVVHGWNVNSMNYCLSNGDLTVQVIGRGDIPSP